MPGQRGFGEKNLEAGSGQIIIFYSRTVKFWAIHTSCKNGILARPRKKKSDPSLQQKVRPGASLHHARVSGQAHADRPLL